eukprot:g2880.t1
MLDIGERPLTSFPPGIESKIEPESGASYESKFNDAIQQDTNEPCNELHASMMLPDDFLLTLLSLRSIVHLNLCGNSLNVEDSESISNGLLNSANRLQTLLLGNNRLGSEGSASILQSLQHHEYIETLDLSCNGIAATDEYESKMDSSESADKESKTTLTPSTSKDKGGQEFSQLLSNMLRSSDCIINLTTMNVKRNSLDHRSVDLICEAVTVRQNVTVLLDYVTLNKRPYMARKKIKAIQLKNIFEAATKIQRNIKKCFIVLKAKRMKEWELMSREDELTNNSQDRASSRKSKAERENWEKKGGKAGKGKGGKKGKKKK